MFQPFIERSRSGTQDWENIPFITFSKAHPFSDLLCLDVTCNALVSKMKIWPLANGVQDTGFGSCS
jgi:hypothetical protein